MARVQGDGLRESHPVKIVLAMGCFDPLHIGHVYHLRAAAKLGKLCVAINTDASINKGPYRPAFPQAERLDMIKELRCVSWAGLFDGWRQAMEEIKPDIYAVNEDGHREEKRAYCEEHGIEYLVLKRTPKEGLAKRSSTELRGF